MSSRALVRNTPQDCAMSERPGRRRQEAAEQLCNPYGLVSLGSVYKRYEMRQLGAFRSRIRRNP